MRHPGLRFKIESILIEKNDTLLGMTMLAAGVVRAQHDSGCFPMMQSDPMINVVQGRSVHLT